jgi:large subunit ribosomal protein L29
MASILRAHELDEMNETDLEARLREAKEELFNLRFQAATGQLESHGRLRTVKKDIARIYTVVRERELGIRSTPGATDDEDTHKTPKTQKVQKARKAQKAQKEGADA